MYTYLLYRVDDDTITNLCGTLHCFCGPLVPVTHDPLERCSPIFFTDNLLSVIVEVTNRYAVQCLAAKNSTTTWETTLDEMKAYLGFMVVMGVNQLPEIRDYWTKLNNSFISSRITRQQFEEITRHMHFVDNTTRPLRDEPGFHRLQKVQPIIAAMIETFSANYNPHPHCSVDKAMIPFKGLRNNSNTRV